jgi:hypothetical protein
MTLFAMSAVVGLLLAGAVVALMVQLLPYIIVGIVIGALLQRRRRHRPRVVQSVCRSSMQPRQAHAVAPSGWAYVPVWVGPPLRPPMPVIDAEVIEDPGRE